MRKLYHSLRFRITAGVLLPLLTILSILSYVQRTNYQNLLIENLQLSAANTGEIIESSLLYAMLTNDFSTVQQILDNIVEQQGVQDLFLLDKEGQVVLSAGNRMVGRKMDLSDATCQACHSDKEARWNESMILTVQGIDTFRGVGAIENKEGCQRCHDPQSRITGVLIADFPMAPVEAQLAVYRRNSLLWSAGSAAIILLVVNLIMSRMVISRLERFVRVIRRVGKGDLDARAVSENPDEIGELSRSFNRMANGLKEKERLEQTVKERTKELQRQAEKLSTLNTLAATVSQSLNLKEILNGALDKVLELMGLRASWVILWDDQSEAFDLAASRGLPEEVARAHVHCACVRCICPDILGSGRPKVFQNGPEYSCSTAEYFQKEDLVFHACIPLQSKDHILGVMGLVGDASNNVRTFTKDTLEMLTAIGRQIGIAVENASLYEELRQKEVVQRQLLERVITAQEEERKRIARELHDQTGQPLTSLIIGLRVFEEASPTPEVQARTQDLRDTATQILQDVRGLALQLRPSVLDDLGLLAALRHYLKGYQDRFHLLVDFEALGLHKERLPPEVETALFRITQEALTNVVRHAQAHSVTVLLEKRETSVMLIVEDDGKGFDVTRVMDSRPRERNLGLYGMRERASFLGGTLTIESTLGTGTTVFVGIPLEQADSNHGKDPSIDS
jgi:signal transduction histidine kinase